jgi:predicted Zn finger-like uncharacterized protein
MITHCPACHTHFRVRAEQLAARAGQVRCGKCGRIFDALEHLSEDLAPARATGSVFGSEVVSAGPAESVRVPEPTGLSAQVINEDAPEPATVETLITPAEPPQPGAETPEADAPRPEAPVATSSEMASETAISEPVRFHPEVKTGTSTFDFGPSVAAQSAKPKRRWPWLTGALLLLLVLLTQAAYQYRGAIILLFPEAKPIAAALCANLGCDLPLPRRIDLMSIEASDLQADTTNPNVMVLSATLKNRGIFNQQHPSIELTLTDPQDQPLVRRVLAPQDYLGKAAGTQAGFGANTEIAIKVFIEGSQIKATGYRLYLFYP